MAILQYRLTVMFPDEYLYWLATLGSAQVEAHHGKGLVSHRVFQNKQDAHELLIVDEWDREPQAFMDYLYREELEGGMSWTQVTAGPVITRLERTTQSQSTSQFEERSLDLKALQEAVGISGAPQEERPIL